MDTAMAGKWICPMHPDVVKDSPGPCDICQMPLQTAESLGYATIDESAKAPLVVPASAPLITGKRAVVYVQVPGVTRPTYQGREVVLGPKAGDYYIVQSGLTEGEIVVTNGNFKIDSALQIQAGPSMMSAVGPSRGGETIEQKTCPVMGGPINKDIFIDYKGKKVYFCCPGCESRFRENPEKYIPRLPQFE